MNCFGFSQVKKCMVALLLTVFVFASQVHVMHAATSFDHAMQGNAGPDKTTCWEYCLRSVTGVDKSAVSAQSLLSIDSYSGRDTQSVFVFSIRRYARGLYAEHSRHRERLLSVQKKE